MHRFQDAYRGLGLLFGGLALLDLHRHLAGWADGWWVSLWPLSSDAAVGSRAIFAALVLGWCFRPEASPTRRRATLVAVWVFAAFALRDALMVASLVDAGRLPSRAPFPLSAAVVAGLALVARGLRRAALVYPTRPLVTVTVAAAGATLFALAQMVCFGATDYRRPADAVVVFGARVYANGQPSLALSDRLLTGCALVQHGIAPRLVVSGGPGDGATHEADAMRQLAIDRCGLPSDRVLVDREGLNTRRTAHNIARLAAGYDIRRVVAVSHGDHLPRVKLAFQEAGLPAFTVPADETRTLTRLPYYMAREVVAFWVYYVSPNLSSEPSPRATANP